MSRHQEGTLEVRTLRSLGEYVRRTLSRRKQRYAVGRAYDMAREIAPYLAPQGRVLDVGCGNGFIAYHLRALLGADVCGVDVLPGATAPITYSRFDGHELDFVDDSFDAVLLCYVLHHAEDPARLLGEARRVLREGGRVVVYEDVPVTSFDRLMCLRHDAAWRGRSAADGGACTFQQPSAWRGLGEALGFDVIAARQLSRLRDIGHPVRRAFYVFEKRR
ncbi:MAG: class I SAM-dependent methyltransferase [Myxococcales bacterium]|nr:class I SAM-dependent methyltransferase [Myxococcales bacterium]